MSFFSPFCFPVEVARSYYLPEFLDLDFLIHFVFLQIDPSIMGGLVVEFGQKVLDMSIRTRAKQMERFLREPINFENF